MGKPSKIEPAKISEDYNWGEFGSANASGVNLSSTASQNVNTAQSGISQYLNELINPSYNNESFRARQELLDASNRQYANELGANAIARGARGSATQNILNSIMANRANDMRAAMTSEDARVKNILSALSGIESNYFGQTNTMANNILDRVRQNAAYQQEANIKNTENYNSWKNNLLSSGIGAATTIAGSVLGGPLGGALGGMAGNALSNAIAGQAAVPGAAIDYGQAMSAAGLM